MTVRTALPPCRMPRRSSCRAGSTASGRLHRDRSVPCAVSRWSSASPTPRSSKLLPSVGDFTSLQCIALFHRARPRRSSPHPLQKRARRLWRLGHGIRQLVVREGRVAEQLRPFGAQFYRLGDNLLVVVRALPVPPRGTHARHSFSRISRLSANWRNGSALEREVVTANGASMPRSFAVSAAASRAKSGRPATSASESGRTVSCSSPNTFCPNSVPSVAASRSVIAASLARVSPESFAPARTKSRIALQNFQRLWLQLQIGTPRI